MDHIRTDENVVRYYETADEDGRLRSGAERLELVRMRDILRRVLPDPPARILDVGGGTGVHAEWLAADGHQVHVVDPVPKHVAAAGAIAGVTASVGDARALDAPDGCYDAVLLMGPLYHLTERADRLAVFAEAARVARPDAVVAAAAISRFSSLFDGMRRGFLARPEVQPIIDRTLEDGTHRPGDTSLFTTAFLHHPRELTDEAREAGLLLQGTYAVEGPPWLLGSIDAWLDDEDRRDLLMWALRRIEQEPSTLGASRHLLTIATTPPARSSRGQR